MYVYPGIYFLLGGAREVKGVVLRDMGTAAVRGGGVVLVLVPIRGGGMVGVSMGKR